MARGRIDEAVDIATQELSWQNVRRRNLGRPGKGSVYKGSDPGGQNGNSASVTRRATVMRAWILCVGRLLLVGLVVGGLAQLVPVRLEAGPRQTGLTG